MKEVTLVDQVMDSLAFEVEEVAQDGQITSASSNSPLNVKIRIRKKNRKQLTDGGIISIPKFDHAVYDSEKVRVSSSDQTIMSFNVLMERGQSMKKRPPKQKRILQMFKRGGCLGVQNDDDQYEYSINKSQQADKGNDLQEPIQSLSNDNLDKGNFTLAKNYSNTEVSQTNRHKHTDFLGKCKPGGCLDPPFGEDKYSYLPKLTDVAVTDATETKSKIKECECKENLPADTKIQTGAEDKNNSSPILERGKNESTFDSKTSLAQIKSSNSIITFPSILPSIEALNKLQFRKRSKSYSESRESKSYNISNQLLETYYISPKIKTEEGLDRDTESKPCLDTKNIYTFSIKDKENSLGDTKPKAYVNSDLGLNESFENKPKIALRSIKNDVMDRVTLGDKTDSLKNQEIDMESPNLPLMENDEHTIINVLPKTGPLSIDESKISFDKQKMESKKNYLDTIPEGNLQVLPKKSVESTFKSENGTKTIIALPHDITVDRIEPIEINGATEVPFNTIVQETTETLTTPVKSDEFKIESVIETISLPGDYSTNKENLKEIEVNTKAPPEEINEMISKTLTRPVESIATENKRTIERIITPTHDLSGDNEELLTKEDGLKNISSIEQHKKDTSNLEILNVSKNIEDDSKMGEYSTDREVMPQENYLFSIEDINKTKKSPVSSPEEKLSFIEAADSTKKKINVETGVLLQDPLHDREELNTIEGAADTHLLEADPLIALRSKSSEDKLTKLVDERDNNVGEKIEKDIGINSNFSVEKIALEVLQSDTNVSTSIKSSKEIKIEHYSLTKLSLQSEKEEKNDVKVDTINSDELIKQDDEDASIINSVTNSEKVSDMHTDVNFVPGNIINNENTEPVEYTELEEIDDHNKSKSGILQDEIYHKDLEVTFSNKVMTESMETSENIFSKPTYETEKPVDFKFQQSKDKTWDRKENFDNEATFPSDDVPVNNKEHKNFKELPMNYNEQKVIHLNMAFQSFDTDQDGSVIRTLNFSSFTDSNRYPNDNILQFKTIIRPNDGEIKIPIDSNKDLVLQIKTDQRYKDQNEGSMKNFPSSNKPISSKFERNLWNEDDDRGPLLPRNYLATEANTLTVTNILDGSETDEVNLQQTLDDVYKDKLLPLHDIIKKLKSDIDELTKQQTLIKEKLYNAKRVQSNPVYASGKKCGCLELFS